MNQPNPWLSVVIPVRGACETLPGCLEALARLEGEGVEALVVGCGGRGETPHPTPRGPAEAGLPTRVLASPAGGAMAARNLGVARARGRVILFIPPDCLAPPGLAARLKRHFERPSAAAVGGGLRPANPESPLAQLCGLEAAYDQTVAADPRPAPYCAAFSRRAWLAAGLDRRPPGDDRELCDRLLARGGEIIMDPDIFVYRPLPATWPEAWRRQVQRGRDMSPAGRRTPGPGDGEPGGALPGRLQPIIILIALGLLAFLGPQAPQAALTLALVCLLSLYFLNRPFLKFVSQKEPALLNRALALCFLRPAAWLAGLAAAALKRLGGN